ncbi:hypothetical protein SEA_SATIS_328 [Streptomyces phage Satis]|nr:hypothetical protein SEA_SATIS_328 [Streptomyces phage Satis]QBZ72214.1 hypothetical protein SEA_KRADAL_328 [Streptomyces phage Kradal]QPL14636.1 hypothetical protein SEA_EHYELIMAYOE_331 [Streptomyces phage EhyElimayoE]
MQIDTTRQNAAVITRGTLLQVADGFVVADTYGTDETGAFWYDTDGKRHRVDAAGCLTVGVPGWRTRDYGQTRGGKGHILLNAVPGRMPQGFCPGSRNADLSVWSAGTALTAVDCNACRRAARLVCGIKR